MIRKIKITNKEHGKRMDIALSHLLNEFSRSHIKKAIEDNLVKVNGQIEYRANYKVSEDDEIEINIEQKHDSPNLVPENISLDVVHEDDNLIAINKPEGMVVHPATGNWTGTVMNGLIFRFKNLKNVGDTIRSGLIHRLDKDTSGLLLVGKSNEGLWHYSKQFSERKVQKSYLAVVFGDSPVQNHFEIKNYTGRHSVNRKKMAVVGNLGATQQNLPADARITHTIFDILESAGRYHLINAFPKTGRTHQIRVHSNYVNLPILGDKIYGGKKCERLMLHALSLKIQNLDGNNQVFIAEPAASFKTVLKEIGFKINIDEYIQKIKKTKEEKYKV